MILFINTRTGKREGAPVTVGTLPDMLTFAPSGRMVLVANEGTPNTRTPGQPYPVDPPGSVSMIDLRIARGHDAAHKPTLPGYAELRQFPATGNGGTRPDMRAYDPEPEYIATDHRSDKPLSGLQEANGVAVLNLRTRRLNGSLALA